MAKIDGSDETPSKLLAGWEHFGKLNWDSSLKQKFAERVKERKLAKPQLANERNALKREEFQLLSPEIQASYETAALRIHTDSKEAIEKRKAAPVLLGPVEAQQ